MYMYIFVYTISHVRLCIHTATCAAIGSGVCFVCNQRASAHLPFPLAKACAWLVANRCQSPAVDCLSDAAG